jgi:hypothetical protein
VLCCSRGALAAVVVAGGLAFAAPGAPGQSPPPACAAGVVAHPVLGARGYPEGEDGDTRLFATHPVTLAAGFPSDGPSTNADVAIAIPPGFVHGSDDLFTNGAIATPFSGEIVSTVVLADQPGALPLNATWTQSDGTDRGVCAGAASASFTTLPAIRPRLTRPKVTRGLPDESTVKLVLPKAGGDLRPVEVRYRAVRHKRFPSARVPAKVVTFALRSSDPGFRRNRPARVKTGALRVLMEGENGETLLTGITFVFNLRVSPKGSPYGYDLGVYQGGARRARLRVAGRCIRNGGFISCSKSRIARG